MPFPSPPHCIANTCNMKRGVDANANTPVPSEKPAPAIWSDPNTIQTIVFSIAACFLGIISIYLSYRQLQTLSRRANRQASTNDIECPQRWQGGRNTLLSSDMVEGEACILLSSDSYAMHRYVGSCQLHSNPSCAAADTLGMVA